MEKSKEVERARPFCSKRSKASPHLTRQHPVSMPWLLVSCVAHEQDTDSFEASIHRRTFLEAPSSSSEPSLLSPLASFVEHTERCDEASSPFTLLKLCFYSLVAHDSDKVLMQRLR